MLIITYTTYTCTALQYGTKTNDLTKNKATYNATNTTRDDYKYYNTVTYYYN